MAIKLEKGQKIELGKDTGLKKITMGLGWDPVKVERKGFLSRLTGGGGGGGDIDLDASVIVMNKDREIVDTVSFSNLRSRDGSIVHGGDNRTGAGDGDDEVIHVDLENLPATAVHLIFTVNSFTGQTFDTVDNAHCRLIDGAKGEEICSYVLSEKGSHTGVIMASVSRTGSGWKMTAHGEIGRGRTVRDLYPQAKDLV